MTTIEVITRIKACIKDAHSFSENLGESTSIHREHLIKTLDDIPPNEIQLALIELQELKEIKFAADPDIILLTSDFKNI